MSAVVVLLIFGLSFLSVVFLILVFLYLKKNNMLPWQNKGAGGGGGGTVNVADAVKNAEARLSKNPADTLAYVSTGSTWQLSELDRWTSGFMTGCWWKMYYLTNNDVWKTLAEQGCKKLLPWQKKTTTHDIGFVIMCSYGNAPSPNASVITTAAESLSKRFMQKVQMFRSWKEMARGDAEVIIDNMMNLRLMFEGARLTPDKNKSRIWLDMAVKHATNTAKLHVRTDGSTFHKVTFNAKTASAIKDTNYTQGTHQGWSANTTWSRGQAWAMYGFTETFEYTQMPIFKDTAIKCCNYFIQNLPADNVPLWDFQAPADKQYKDSSAAAIAACALFRLGKLVGDSKYTSKANDILSALSSSYLGSSKGFASLLCCGVGNMPKGLDVNVGYIVSDYYYLEALQRSAS